MAHIYRAATEAPPTPPVTPTIITTLTGSTVSANNTTKTLLAANASRVYMMISNGFNADTTNFTLYVKFGAGASTSSYSLLLAPGFTYESGEAIYRGIVTCILASAGPNNVQVSEGV